MRSLFFDGSDQTNPAKSRSFAHFSNALDNQAIARAGFVTGSLSLLAAIRNNIVVYLVDIEIIVRNR